MVTNCNRLKLTAQDGKKRLTDVSTADGILRIVQSIPSPKAEPIKMWLAQVGCERMQELAALSMAIDLAPSSPFHAKRPPFPEAFFSSAG